VDGPCWPIRPGYRALGADEVVLYYYGSDPGQVDRIAEIVDAVAPTAG
jgi:hypothetical protein